MDCISDQEIVEDADQPGPEQPVATNLTCMTLKRHNENKNTVQNKLTTYSKIKKVAGMLKIE